MAYEFWGCAACGRVGTSPRDLTRQGCEGTHQRLYTAEEADQRASAAMTSEKAVHAACRSLIAHVPTVAPGAMQAALEAAALELYGEPVGKEKDG